MRSRQGKIICWISKHHCMPSAQGSRSRCLQPLCLWTWATSVWPLQSYGATSSVGKWKTSARRRMMPSSSKTVYTSAFLTYDPLVRIHHLWTRTIKISLIWTSWRQKAHRNTSGNIKSVGVIQETPCWGGPFGKWVQTPTRAVCRKMIRKRKKIFCERLWNK